MKRQQKWIILSIIFYSLMSYAHYLYGGDDRPKLYRRNGESISRWTELSPEYVFKHEIDNGVLRSILFSGDMSTLDFSNVQEFSDCDFRYAFWSDKERASEVFTGKILNYIRFSGDISVLNLGNAKELRGIDFISVPDNVLRNEKMQGLLENRNVEDFHFAGDVSFLGFHKALSFYSTDFSMIPDDVLLKSQMKDILIGKDVSMAKFRGNIRYLGLKGASRFDGVDISEVSDVALLSKELENIFRGKSANGVLFGGNISQLGLKNSSNLGGIDLREVPDVILRHSNLHHLFANQHINSVDFKGDIRNLGFTHALSFYNLDFSLVPESYFCDEGLRDLFQGKKVHDCKLKGKILPMGLHKAKYIDNISLIRIDLSGLSDDAIIDLFSKIKHIFHLSFSQKPLSNIIHTSEKMTFGPEPDICVLFLDNNNSVRIYEKYNRVIKMRIFIDDILDIDWEDSLAYLNQDTFFGMFVLSDGREVFPSTIKEWLSQIKNFQNLYNYYEYSYVRPQAIKSKEMGKDFIPLGPILLCILEYGFPAGVGPDSEKGYTTRRSIFKTLGFKKEILEKEPSLTLKSFLLNRKFLLYYSLYKPKGKKPVYTLLDRVYRILKIKDSREEFFYKLFDILFQKEKPIKNEIIIEFFLSNPLLLDVPKYFASDFKGEAL